MSAFQTRSQRKASALRHRAIAHLKVGGTIKVHGRYWMLVSGMSDQLVLDQPVCMSYERDNVLVVPYLSAT